MSDSECYKSDEDLIEETGLRVDPSELDASREKFLDEDFPPKARSLANTWKEIDQSMRSLWKSFKFKRVESIYNKPIKVFNNISPNDILQGYLGDCYFLSAISAIAEYPERIQRLFETQEHQPFGRYSVTFYEKGVKTSIVLDDYFPCTEKGLAFSGPKIENEAAEIWVLLLEKAWAKRFGTYWAIDSGYTEDVLRDLTGAPCEVNKTGGRHLWKKIIAANDKKFIITAGSNNNDDMEDEVGIIPLHAYAVLDAKKVQLQDRAVKLVNLRNPLGRGEWKGDWSDSSELWTSELKSQLMIGNCDDGNFWMSFKDLKKYFSEVTICMLSENYTHVGINKGQEKVSVFEVRTLNGGDTYFNVTFDDTRKYWEKSQYPPVWMTVAKKDGENLEKVYGKSSSSERDVWIQAELAAGEYLVHVKVKWTTGCNKFGFSVYSASPTQLSEMDSADSNFSHKVFKSEGDESD